MRGWIIFGVGVLLIAAFLYVTKELHTVGWAQLHNNKWSVAGDSVGWGILLYAWPIAILGGIAGGGIAWLILIYIWYSAENLDHAAENERLKKKAQRAEELVRNADKLAASKLQKDLEHAENLRLEANQEMGRVREMGQKVAAELVQARAMAQKAGELRAKVQQEKSVIIESARSQINNSKKKARNAAAKAQRLAKKLNAQG